MPIAVEVTEAKAADIIEPAGEEKAAHGGEPAMAEEDAAAEDVSIGTGRGPPIGIQ
jgi:hypothetical protein